MSDATRPDLEPGIYRHFKGSLYQVLYVARHSETEEDLVVYCAVDHPQDLWARPRSMFVEPVDSETGPVPRFSFEAPACTAIKPRHIDGWQSSINTIVSKRGFPISMVRHIPDLRARVRDSRTFRGMARMARSRVATHE